MYNFVDSYYKVDVFEETILHTWYKSEILEFANEEIAIEYAKKMIKNGKHAKIYQVNKVTGWE